MTVDGSGLSTLVTLLRLQGVAVEPAQLEHQMGLVGEPVGVVEMLRCARRLGLKARSLSTRWERLSRTPLPGIAQLRDGSFLLLGKATEDKVLVQVPGSAGTTVMTREQFEAQWNGHLVLMMRQARLGDPARLFDLGWFVAALHKYRALLGEVLLASFFLQLFALLVPLLFQVVIDKVLVHRSLTTLEVVAVAIVGLAMAETLLAILRTYLFAHTTNRVDVELGARLFRHLMALPLSYFQSRRVGDSVARVRELENIRTFLTSSALTLVIDLLFTLVFVAVLFLYSTLLATIVVAAFPVYVAISLVAAPLFRRRLDEKFRRGADNQAFLVENVSGVETVKSVAAEPQMQRRWEDQLAGYVAASFRVLSLANTTGELVQLVAKLVNAAVLFFGARLAIEGSLSIGELVAFTMIAGKVSAPVLRLAQIWQDFHQTRLSVQRLGDILNTPTEPTYAPGRASLPSIQGDIVFDRASFRYRPDGERVLADVSFRLSPGEVVGIVGVSGSGKSTIAKLIQRLYVPETGRVLVDGMDLAMADPAWLRRQIGVVLQESVLFNGTVRDNIALADPGMELSRVVAASKLAGAHDFVLRLPEGYDTVVGERGAGLSGGQRQRIAIARALVGDPRILIFDEATSALDYESERVIQENMRQIVRGRTVVVIAHRLSTLRIAGRVLTIDEGRLVEDGTHDELMRVPGRYAALYGLQAGMHAVH